MQIEESVAKLKTIGKQSVKIFINTDTDSILAGAILIRALQRANIFFSATQFNNQSIPQENAITINLNQKASIQLDTLAAVKAYKIAKQLNPNNTDLAALAVISLVHLNKTQDYPDILTDANVTTKQGAIISPATRPIDRVLESSCNLYIPGVTGSLKGTLELLHKAGIPKNTNGYKPLLELNEEEMNRLISALASRSTGGSLEVGKLYLVKLSNQTEDARELAEFITTCKDQPELAMGLCLGNKTFRKEAERTYAKYRKNIAATIAELETAERETGPNYEIITLNKTLEKSDVITATKIMAKSPLTPQETTLTTIMRTEETTEVIMETTSSRNVKEMLEHASSSLPNISITADENSGISSCNKNEEAEFLDNLRHSLNIEMIRV